MNYLLSLDDFLICNLLTADLAFVAVFFDSITELNILRFCFGDVILDPEAVQKFFSGFWLLKKQEFFYKDVFEFWRL